MISIKKKLPVLLLFLFFSSCIKDLNKEEDTPNADFEIEVFNLINAHRISIGKEALVWNAYVASVAREHSKNMANGSVDFGHDGFSERADLVKAELSTTTSAENVAYGYSTAEAVVNAWLNSSGHKKNIEGNYTISGVGIEYSTDGLPYFTQLFFSK